MTTASSICGQALLESGPIAELRDPQSNYGLRITAMTPAIKAMRAYAPAGADFVSIEPQFNYDDPFGREWASDEDTGMVVLQPGQSVAVEDTAGDLIADWG